MAVRVVDGRVARAERSRRAVAEAVIELCAAGNSRPTAAQIASHAGVSLRLVHHHFRDREALFVAAADHQMARSAPLVDTVSPALPLHDRLDAFARSRARLLEAITPIRRAALTEALTSETVRRRLDAFRKIKRDQVAHVFAAELTSGPDQLHAAATAASWSSWEELRAYQRLSVARARRVLRATLATILQRWT